MGYPGSKKINLLASVLSVTKLEVGKEEGVGRGAKKDKWPKGTDYIILNYLEMHLKAE